MTFDFDTELPLRGQHTAKYDAIEKAYGTYHPDMVAMWVADMDFAAAPVIREALQKELDFGYLGYFSDPAPVNQAVADWMSSRHGWSLDPNIVRYTHGVISGYGDVITAYSDPGDSVVVFSPVYHAFFRQIEAMGRTVLESNLVERDGRYHMDLDALAAKLTGREKIVTLCSPHNPGGRVWTKDEIRALAEFCATYDLYLISDEIHGDMILGETAFVPTAVAAPEHLDRIVVLTAASKSFNIAGLETGLLMAPDAGVRKALDAVILDRESSPSRIGMAAIHAAYSGGADWFDAARDYIRENARIFEDRINALPGVHMMPMEATYLAWVDFSGTGMTGDEIQDRLLNTARVVTNAGKQFRGGADTFARFNLALPRTRLMRAIKGIEIAFADLQ